MAYKKTKYSEHIEHVELTPPASRTVATQTSRRTAFVLGLVALLLLLCAMASAQVTAAAKAAGVYHNLVLPPFLLW